MSQKSNKKKNPPSGAPVPVRPNTLRSAVSISGAAAATVEEIEPSADDSPVPAWFFIVLIALVYWGMLHLDQYGGGFSEFVYGPYQSTKQLADFQPKSGPEMLAAKGEAIYGMVCVACHQSTGLGSPGQYPPLVGSEWVTGSPGRLIRIPMHGLLGPIEVKGLPWNLNMPGFGAAPPLDNDENLAAVLTYIRRAWGNSAPAITPQQVKAVRDETATRTAQWTADELLKIPETP